LPLLKFGPSYKPYPYVACSQQKSLQFTGRMKLSPVRCRAAAP